MHSDPRKNALQRGWLTVGTTLLATLSPVRVLSQNAVDRDGLEEVVVTARMFREDIASIPMSVQSISGDFLDRRDLSNLYDLQYAIPGFVLNSRGMFGAGISLRGVSDEGGGLSVAPHLDGVYLGRSTLALARQFDVERVEVVKGPQGTLYGRNSTGGSLNVFTRVPEPEFGAGLEFGQGSFDTTRANGYLNVAGDRAAARISFAGSAGDGFIRNSVDERRFAEDDFWGVRASVRAQPDDALTIDVMLQRVDDDGASGELWGPRLDHLPDPGDIRLTTVRVANPYLDITNEFASVNVSYEPGALTFRSITGYARSLTRNLDDCAGVPFLPGCVRGVAPLRYEQYSQELRLGSQGVDPVDWIVGAYFVKGKEDERFSLRLAAPPRPVQDYAEISDESAWAVFGDSTFKLNEHWRLNGGLRFTREDHRLRFAGNGVGDPDPSNASGSWDSVSWKAGVDYTPDDALFYYASVSTGFKSGGLTRVLLPNGENDDYDPEKNTAYEVGMTAKGWAGRSMLRASAFVYDFQDLQVTTTSVIDGVPSTVIDNAASASIRGIDLSANTRVGEHLTLAGMFLWLPRREYVSFTDEFGNSLAGNKITRASEWSASASINWRIPLAGAGEFGATIDYNYRSSFYFTKENVWYASQGDFGLLNCGIRFDSAQGGWYAFASARNLLNEDYFTQIFLQSAPGYPARYELGFGWRR